MRFLAATACAAACLAASGAAAKTPLQELIAFTSDRHWNQDEVWITTSDGAREYQTLPRFSEQSRAVGSPAWAPDHRRLAVVTDRGVAILDVRGRMIRYALRTRAALDSAWSPDGQQLVVTLRPPGRFSYLAVVRLMDRRVRRVGRVRGCAPSWSPDGRWIAFQQPCSTPETQLGVAVVHPDGTHYRRIGPVGSFGSDWSPDGRTLLWIRDRKVELHRIGDGTTTTLPLKRDATHAAFSPDGDRIVYEALERAACGEPPQEQDHFDGQLYVVALGGGEERSIGNCEGDGGDRAPDW
jgi:Tol biopolymer transport system component